MEEFIIYIAKSAICLGVFFTIYTLFLRKTTFFRFNRIFLMFGFIASLVLPFAKYTYDVKVSIPIVSVIENAPVATTVAQPVQSLDVWTVLIIVYITGIALLIVRNLYTYFKLSRLVAGGTKYHNEGFKLVENKDIDSPFTFLNYILINSNNLSNTEQDLIIKHETTHINQKHWIDLLCCECILLMQWFSPVAWIYVHLLKENHEFLADKAVIDSGISPAVYRAVLINQEFKGPVFSFSNSFNYLKPLNRLNMMKRSKSAAWKRIAVLFVIPVFGVFLWASSEPNYIIEQTEMPVTQEDSTAVNLTIFTNNKDRLSGNNKVFIINNDSIITNVAKSTTSVRHLEKEPLYVVDGVKTVSQTIKNINPEDIDHINILKDSSSILAGYGKEGENGVVIINTKKYERENPGLELKQNNTIQVSSIQDKRTKNIQVEVIDVGIAEKKDRPLFVVDNEIMTPDNFSKLDPNKIAAINVLKKGAATSLFGEKGKNGVIQVYTKEYSEKQSESNSGTNIPSLKGKPMKVEFHYVESDNGIDS